MQKKTLGNRFNKHGSPSNYKTCRVLAKLQFKKKSYMTPKQMRVYWESLREELWGQCEMTTRRLKGHFKLESRGREK